MSSVPVPPTPPPRVPRRIPKACKKCRAAKIKCSGQRPCDRCVRRGDNCVFPSCEPQVMVQERYLLHLQSRLQEMESSARPLNTRRESQPDPVHVPQPQSPRPRTAITTVPPLEPPPGSEAGPSESIHQVGQANEVLPIQASPTHGRPLSREEDMADPSTSHAPHRITSTDVSGNSEADPMRNEKAVQEAARLQLGSQNQTGVGSRDRPIPHNPLLSRSLAYVRDTNGRPRFLGPSSTWSFCRHALLILEAHSPSPDGSTAPLNLDGAAFSMYWSPKAKPDEDDLKNLPPSDYAIYLFNTVKFHLAELFVMIDETSFMENLHSFQKHPWETVKTQRLWFIEYLLFLAYGQAFLASGRGNNAPAGSQLVARALALIPDPASMHENPMLGAEVLALVSLYLHSIDMRAAAFQYIGQALRLTYIAGIHRPIAEDIVNPDFAARCNNLWWGVYVLDQELSAGMGAPNSVPESYPCPDLPLERSTSLSAGVLTLRIRLSKLIANICSRVYGAEEDMGDVFIRNTSNVLHELAEVSREFDEINSTYGEASRIELPHMFTQVSLLFHHCIVLATRPLVMWLLTLKVQVPLTEPQQLDGPVAVLLQKSATSATTVISKLRALTEKNTLDTFLPFQLEYAFSSGMLLFILGAILPSYISDASWYTSIHVILNEMIRRENPVARIRKSELEQLETLLIPLRPQIQGTAHGSPTCPAVNENCTPYVADDTNVNNAPDGCSVMPWEFPYGNEVDMFANSDQIVQLADQLQSGGFADPFLFDFSG